MLPFKTILCPVDFSAGSRLALEAARTLARTSGGKVVALFVAAPALMVTDGVMAAPLLGEEEADPHSLKSQLREFVSPRRGEIIELCVDFGNPGEEILDQASVHKADLIVMGTHGRTGLGRLLLGSVAEHVLRRANCPVLLIKGTPQEEATSAGTPS
jgi:universal stress protein A